jgi:hypothetical protein
MANYNEQLNDLFREWKKESEKNNEPAFCCDGLMYKCKSGDPKNEVDEPLVDELWDKSKKRIMFLMKDPKEDSGDSRTWINDGGVRYVTLKLFKVLAYWLYGLSNAKNGKTADLETITYEKLVDCFNKIPFAYIESKKQAGKSSVKDAVLSSYISRYRDYLIKQIEILNPNVIICCGKPQYDFVLQLFSGAEKIDDNIFYHKEKQKLIFNSYHPSYYRGVWNYPETFYKDLMEKYAKFLEKYPDF